jgi:cytosolic carboxypeptidase protein 5
VYYKYSWTFEVLFAENEYYFAYAPPYTYAEITQSISLFQQHVPEDCAMWREVLTRSLDGRDVEIITISHKGNFTDVAEAAIPDLFPCNKQRCWSAKKPVVFISARVHPGETPASFVLDGIFNVLLSDDPRGLALRNNFVFKIIPVINPDGVYRGNFRVDQQGLNLNRCYALPDLSTQPTVFAIRKYFECLSPKVRYYFDLHAHASKRCCFLFGNNLEMEKQVEAHLLAKLMETNSGYFEFNECDFSEKSMSSKDPKDHHSKEGSGRVAFYKLSGLIHSYTLECAYFIQRPTHAVTAPMHIKTGRRWMDTSGSDKYVVKVHNRAFFDDIAQSVVFSILDYEKISPISRLPLSEFRFLEAARDWVKARAITVSRIQGRKPGTRGDCKSEKRGMNNGFPKIKTRRVQKMTVISPMYQENIALPGKIKVMICMARAGGGKSLY